MPAVYSMTSSAEGAGPYAAIVLPIGPEVGAVCGKAARTDLGGGREVTRVPTAKGLPSAPPPESPLTEVLPTRNAISADGSDIEGSRNCDRVGPFISDA
jgi:hypothetical protein